MARTILEMPYSPVRLHTTGEWPKDIITCVDIGPASFTVDPTGAGTMPHALTRIELQTMVLSSLGLNCPQIGAETGISANTIKSQRIRTLHKLRAAHVAQATATCFEQGIYTTVQGLEPYRLAPREIEILELAQQGMSRAETAAQLDLQEVTVKSYIGVCLRKMRAPAIGAAVLLGRLSGELPTSALQPNPVLPVVAGC